LDGYLLDRPASDLLHVDLDSEAGRMRGPHPAGLQDHAGCRPAEGIGIDDPEAEDEFRRVWC
jgi:hypothetical protein